MGEGSQWPEFWSSQTFLRLKNFEAEAGLQISGCTHDLDVKNQEAEGYKLLKLEDSGEFRKTSKMGGYFREIFGK